MADIELFVSVHTLLCLMVDTFRLVTDDLVVRLMPLAMKCEIGTRKCETGGMSNKT